MRGAAFFVLLMASACDARSQLGVMGERSPGTGGSIATTTTSTTSATTSAGTGGAAPLVACHPGEAPTVVAMNTGAWGIALDSTDVYFAGLYTQSVGHVEKLGGAVDTLATKQISPWFVAVDGAGAYWTNSCSGAGCGVFAWPKAGGAPTQIATSPYADGIAVDDTAVFWIASNGPAAPTGAVMRMPKAGGPVQQLVTGLEHPWSIALDDAFAYWTDEDAGTVGRVPKGGGPKETVASTSVGVWALAVDDARVYWSVYVPYTGFVGSAAKSGGATTMLAMGLDQPAGVAVDAESLYVAVQGTGAPGSILKVSKGGGTAAIVATNQQRPSNVAVDDACVYWANGDGTVMRAPK